MLSGLALAMVLSSCTALKPVVCAFTYPIDVMSDSVAVPEDDEDDYAEIPPPLIIATAPILIPLRFVSLSVMGIAGGLVSGFASDLNMILWNADKPWTNLSRPFHTNARPPRPD